MRCDGMHFGSDYLSFACHGSMSVWHAFLADYLEYSGLAQGHSEREAAEAAAPARGTCVIPRASAERASGSAGNGALASVFELCREEVHSQTVTHGVRR